MSTKFQRRCEDFKCERCGSLIKGNGYTNHCSQCLWSKHVDINPGDRAQMCKGLMEPIAIEIKAGKYTIIHRCTVCAFERSNKLCQEDNFDTVIKIISQNKIED